MVQRPCLGCVPPKDNLSRPLCMAKRTCLEQTVLMVKTICCVCDMRDSMCTILQIICAWHQSLCVQGIKRKSLCAWQFDTKVFVCRIYHREHPMRVIPKALYARHDREDCMLTIPKSLYAGYHREDLMLMIPKSCVQDTTEITLCSWY